MTIVSQLHHNVANRKLCRYPHLTPSAPPINPRRERAYRGRHHSCCAWGVPRSHTRLFCLIAMFPCSCFSQVLVSIGTQEVQHPDHRSARVGRAVAAPCLSVLSCLSCFFYDLMSCAVSWVFFWFVCCSSLCYRYWWHGDGTDMRTPRTDGTDMRTPFLLVTPVVTCWLHWCLLTCLLAVLAGHAGAWLLVVLFDHAAACLLVVLAGCACFLAGIGGAVKLRSSTSVCLFFFMSVSVFLVFLNNPPTPTQ